jgi:2-aminoadipate transaminase
VRDVEANVLRELLKVSARPEIVSFAGGMPAGDLFDIEGLRDAAASVLSDEPVAALQYGGSEGTPELRSELCRLMHDRGAEDLDEQSMIVTTGSSQGIDLVGRTLLDPGDVIAVEKPTFLATLTMARLCRAQVVEVEGDAAGMVPEDLRRVLRSQRVKVLYLTPTFSNPTGAVLDLERRVRTLELAVEHGVIVIEDDPYGLLWFREEPPPTLFELAADIQGARELCVYLGSLSKIVAPGLRLGWMIAAPPIIEKAAVVKQVADAHSSSLDQAIATRYLRSGRLPANVERARAAYAERSEWLARALASELPDGTLRHTPPIGGMFLWCHLAAPSAVSLATKALEHGVAVVPGDPFFATPPKAQYLRLSYSMATAESSVAGAARLRAALGVD